MKIKSNVANKQIQISKNVANENVKKENDPSKHIEYDDLVTSAGELGVYQVCLFFATCPIYVFGAFSYFSQIFMTEVSPNHWCWIPELENLTAIERRSLAIPQDESYRFGYSKCSAYVADWKSVLSSGLKPNNSWPTETCRYGWEFNKSEIPYPTISSEMNWVCDKNSYQASAQSFFFLGATVGGILVGWMADQYGRIPAGIFSNMIGCIAGAASIFAGNFIEFTVCRFIMGMSYDNSMMMIFLLILEYVSPKYRTIIANLSTGVFFTIGVVILPWIALACGHWKILCLVTSLPMALSALTFYMIPESPRWLMSKGRIDEAIDKLLYVGRINKKEIPADIIEKFKFNLIEKPAEIENSNILEVFRRPLLRCVMLCVCIDFMCCCIIFDALVRILDSLSFNFFLSFTFMSFTELPSLILVSFALDFTGRKWLSIITLIMCGVFSILTVFAGNGLASVLCTVIARFGVNICYMACVQWVAELLPTSVRGAGTSLVHISGFLATIISPYIVYTEHFIPGLPLIIIGGIAAVGVCAILTLPETAGKEMPQTFDEAEDLIRGAKFFDVPFLRK